MNRKLLVAGTILALASLVSGCASVDIATRLNGQQLTAQGDTPIAHLNANNWGIYWFPIIPLITGNTRNPGMVSVFEDNVTVKDVVDMTTARSMTLGATKLTDLQSSTTSVLVFPIPPFLLWYKAVQVSGNAIR